MEIRALIVDDEPLAQNVIRQYAEKLPTLVIADSCNDAICAHKILQEKQIDLLFLDINMPGISGIDFLKTQTNPPLVVFTTAYSEYALEGFELNAIDYLKKPFSFERFCKAFFRAEEMLLLQHPKQQNRTAETDKEFIFVKSDKRNVSVKIADIQYIEGLGDYIKVHLADKKIVTNLSMKKILEQLPQSNFYRIHKSFIVAIDKIELIEGNMVKVNKIKIPIGNSYRQDFSVFIKSYMAE